MNNFSQVRWNIWDAIDEPYLAPSRRLTRGRVLLECQYGWFWYLGDRVVRQPIRAGGPQVPGHPPPRVLMTSRYTLAEIERFTTPDLDLSQHLRPALSYSDYFKKYLASSLESEEWRDKVEEEKAAKARASWRGSQRCGCWHLQVVGARYFCRRRSRGYRHPEATGRLPATLGTGKKHSTYSDLHVLIMNDQMY